MGFDGFSALVFHERRAKMKKQSNSYPSKKAIKPPPPPAPPPKRIISEDIKMSLFHIHWMIVQFKKGMNIYRQCRCGKRDYVSEHGYSPIDKKWLKGERNG